MSPPADPAPAEIADLPHGPHLVGKLKEDRGGVDFLNLRQVNLDLMSACIPGQNNVTANVRSYSVMCWIYWKFFVENQRLGNHRLPPGSMPAFRQKVESLFLWGHLLNGVRGVAGTRSKPPKPVRGRTSLRFADWGNRSDDTSIQAAVRYGPSLTELSLLERGESSYHVTEIGQQLAQALDSRLKRSGSYAMLTDFSEHSGTEEDAQSLFAQWRCDETSAAEQAAMQAVLFDRSRHDDTRTALGRRSAFVEAVIRIIEAARSPLSVAEVRDGLAFRRTLSGSQIKLPPGPEEITRWWFVLQLRQVERLALEVAMGWMESQLLASPDGSQMPALVESAAEILAAEQQLPKNALVARFAGSCSRPIRSEAEFHAAREEDPARHDLQTVATRIWELCDAREWNPALAAALRALCLLWNCSPWLAADPKLRELIVRGGTSRISLQHWFTLMSRYADRSMPDFLTFFFENLIFSQHLAVATDRFDGYSSRLRFALGEAGIESLVDEAWRPGISADHLEAFLHLLASSGVLDRSGERFSLPRV